MQALTALRHTDIYLLDQILRDRIAPQSKVLDAGCGTGRNLPYFLLNDHEVFAVDTKPEALERARARAREAANPDDPGHFRLEALESLSFKDQSFDFVIANAVLHFARDQSAFEAMLAQLVRVTKRGGQGFCRLASSIGIEAFVKPVEDGTCPRCKLLPDGTQRFLVDIAYLEALGRKHGLELLEPIKTVNVQNLRAMTNWIWRRT